ncbi:hypothetical protein AB5J03_001192 [Yersinia enterocolitica]|nr:hypothetical protein [Yersinia enterocolitica]EKN3994034.1 hypothetical protein [Yersinia enterocolitica]EKN5082769.1 hypothetical protein [Yersinia enterocolitica]EKN6402124.1 hypothetical protein [Yersinia enterocolitica]EKP3832272.1 hypothetical protein [Yersinia enterocolitica]
MAGKKQNFDNSEFKSLAGNFKKYNDLTIEGKRIVIEIIRKCAGKKGYPKEKVYYVLFNCWNVNRDSIKYWLDYYFGLHNNDTLPSDNTVRKFLTITKQLSVAMVEAHNSGVKLFRTTQDGLYYLTPVQKYEIDKMYDSGLSAQEMVTALQKVIDDSAK